MFTRSRIALGALVASSLLFAGCRVNPFGGVVGSGNVKTETREVSNFTSVELNGSAELEITQGNTESLEVEADDNLLPLLTSEVRNGRLILGAKPNTSFRTFRRMVFRLTARNLNEIVASGSGSVTVRSFEAEDLSLRLTGSGSIDIASLSARAVNVVASGSGSVSLNGSADSQDVSVTGSGSYGADRFATQNATVTVSGSGSASVNVSGQLDATVTGSGSISYSGNPTVRKTVSGSGSVSGR